MAAYAAASSAMEETNPGKEEEKKHARTTNLPAEIPPRRPHREDPLPPPREVRPSLQVLLPVTDPAHRRKLPQVLAGFLYDTNRVNSPFHDFHFASVSPGTAPPIDPSLPFLPPDAYLYVFHFDICNGLLLCLAHMAPPPSSPPNVVLESHYVVCNPATGRWVDLPRHPKVSHRIMARLAFDPAVSSHFHVIEFESHQGQYITGVNVYSSRTRAWNHKECPLAEKFVPYSSATSVFFHDRLHFLSWLYPIKTIDADAVLVAVGMEGQVRETIRVPSGGVNSGTIGLSQGCLHYATTSSLAVTDMNHKKEGTSQHTKLAVVWHMKDYDSKEWVVKHTVSIDELRSITAGKYHVTAIHPECDTIFLDSCHSHALASYDFQHRKFHHILHLEKTKGGQILPYVPLFSDSLAGADGQYCYRRPTACVSGKNSLFSRLNYRSVISESTEQMSSNLLLLTLLLA